MFYQSGLGGSIKNLHFSTDECDIFSTGFPRRIACFAARFIRLPNVTAKAQLPVPPPPAQWGDHGRVLPTS